MRQFLGQATARTVNEGLTRLLLMGPGQGRCCHAVPPNAGATWRWLSSLPGCSIRPPSWPPPGCSAIAQPLAWRNARPRQRHRTRDLYHPRLARQRAGAHRKQPRTDAVAKRDDRPGTGCRQVWYPWLRTTMLQLAWPWLRHQPDSALSRWFHERVECNGGRFRKTKTMITALARKLLVALWKYATAGVVIEGATMRTASQ
jgi:hypothetical protein